jgi:hypothetical protein
MVSLHVLDPFDAALMTQHKSAHLVGYSLCGRRSCNYHLLTALVHCLHWPPNTIFFTLP